MESKKGKTLSSHPQPRKQGGRARRNAGWHVVSSPVLCFDIYSISQSCWIKKLRAGSNEYASWSSVLLTKNNFFRSHRILQISEQLMFGSLLVFCGQISVVQSHGKVDVCYCWEPWNSTISRQWPNYLLLMGQKYLLKTSNYSKPVLKHNMLLSDKFKKSFYKEIHKIWRISFSYSKKWNTFLYNIKQLSQIFLKIGVSIRWCMVIMNFIR